jgi:hypothetical protein
MLNQRISQQNKSSLLSFSAQIFFSDESTVTLHSIEELRTYTEIRSINCKAIHISWDYMIQFEDKNYPEKQQINILIDTKGDDLIKFPNRSFSFESEGLIRISINHTARTWAVDIESLLHQYFNSLIDKRGTFKKFLHNNSGTISLIAALCFFISIISISINTTNQFSLDTLASVNKNLNNVNLSTDDRINFLSNYIAEGAWNQFTQKLVLFIIFGFLFSIVLLVALESILSKIVISYCFININNDLDKQKHELSKKEKSVWINLLGTIIISIICGIIANYLFRYLTV